jgi:hypothetical protein
MSRPSASEADAFQKMVQGRHETINTRLKAFAIMPEKCAVAVLVQLSISKMETLFIALFPHSINVANFHPEKTVGRESLRSHLAGNAPTILKSLFTNQTQHTKHKPTQTQTHYCGDQDRDECHPFVRNNDTAVHSPTQQSFCIKHILTKYCSHSTAVEFVKILKYPLDAARWL